MIKPPYTDPQEAPHVPAAFINAIAEEGTKAEAIEWLQKQWNENCALRKQMREQNARQTTSVAQTPWTLVEAWRNEAVKHRAASGEDDCHAGTEEWFLHRESARIYASCADQLANTLSPSSDGTARDISAAVARAGVKVP
jgi:hypothetical protein